ncbi:hypothetical protein QN277_001923 [Acacia crassicarpa]|uniref:Uncharacterized protein n=1 Tax=Acacia crassicarpa TaxID=499986 RepID=A0AAE1N8E5_9FABA|nr:hypothetical protein QN277_001923 [Acacia crassicarpa]
MEEAIDTETHKKMADELNQTDLTSETETAHQQMVELQPLLSSQPSDSSHNHFQQQQHVYASPFASATMAEVTDSFVSAQPLKSPANLINATVEDEMTKEIREVIENCGDGLLLPDRCIYKVPITLPHLKEEAYTPKLVSIGPFSLS